MLMLCTALQHQKYGSLNPNSIKFKDITKHVKRRNNMHKKREVIEKANSNYRWGCEGNRMDQMAFELKCRRELAAASRRLASFSPVRGSRSPGTRPLELSVARTSRPESHRPLLYQVDLQMSAHV